MTHLQHLNAGWLHAPPNPRICCHCLLLRDPAGLALVDTGIGLEDVRDPAARVGEPAISLAGFQFDEADTARRQLERQRIDPDAVTHLILTHLDPDHAGGLADFPRAAVHVSAEERAASTAGDWRYRPIPAGSPTPPRAKPGSASKPAASTSASTRRSSSSPSSVTPPATAALPSATATAGPCTSATPTTSAAR